MGLTRGMPRQKVAYSAETIVADLVIGDVYRFRGFGDGRGGWAVPPGDYRLVGHGLHVTTRQQTVAVIGVGGPDDGRYYFMGLEDWVRNFAPPERTAVPPDPASVVPEKANGVTDAAGLLRLKSWGQALANRLGEDVLLLTYPDVKWDFVSRLCRLVPISAASKVELESGAERFVPQTSRP